MGSGDGERVENGEAKKAFVFKFVGEDDVTDVEEVMSENVDDSDEVLEPDERDRSAPIPGCRDNNNSPENKRFDITCSFTSFLPFTTVSSDFYFVHDESLAVHQSKCSFDERITQLSFIRLGILILIF